jgi:FkbM family methyltransferase
MSNKPTKAFDDWGDESKLVRLMRKVRVALTPRSALLAAKLENGAVVYGRNRAGFGGRGAFIFRDSLEPELKHLTKFLEPEGVFIDIGANTGVFTLKAAKHYGGTRGTVIAIEPFAATAAVLTHSVLQNGFTNVRVRNFAAGAKTEQNPFWMNNELPNMFGLDQSDSEARPISVLTVALDDLVQWEHLMRVDFIKIDVEGAEEKVLEGAQETLKRFRPIIVMEIILNDAQLSLPNYTLVEAPGSINKVYIPNESNKIAVAKALGWSVKSLVPV